MGRFEDITSNLPDLATLTSTRIEDVHPDDFFMATDGDDDTLTVAYCVRDECDGSPIVGAFHLHTPPDGVVVGIDAAERLAEWLVMFIDQAKEAGLE